MTRSIPLSIVRAAHARVIAGEPIAAVAADLGYTRYQLHHAFRSRKLPTPPRRTVRPVVAPDEAARRIALHRRHLAGESAGSLAREAGIGYHALLHWWRDHGLSVVRRTYYRVPGLDPALERAIALRARGVPAWALLADCPDLAARFSRPSALRAACRVYARRRDDAMAAK